MDHATSPVPPRRDFLKRASAVVIGIILGAVPFGAGLAVLLDPLRRKGGAGGLLKVATLAALPPDGIPRKFTVLSTRIDAWNRFSQIPVGAVYLRRTSDREVHAFNVVCPHAGCFVDYLPDRQSYLCPCHNSTFNVEGRIANASSPSPRGLDSLTVEIRNQDEIWVRFENFQAGRPEKIPLA